MDAANFKVENIRALDTKLRTRQMPISYYLLPGKQG